MTATFSHPQGAHLPRWAETPKCQLAEKHGCQEGVAGRQENDNHVLGLSGKASERRTFDRGFGGWGRVCQAGAGRKIQPGRGDLRANQITMEEAEDAGLGA